MAYVIFEILGVCAKPSNGTKSLPIMILKKLRLLTIFINLWAKKLYNVRSFSKLPKLPYIWLSSTPKTFLLSYFSVIFKSNVTMNIFQDISKKNLLKRSFCWL